MVGQDVEKHLAVCGGSDGGQIHAQRGQRHIKGGVGGPKDRHNKRRAAEDASHCGTNGVQHCGKR